MLGHVYIEVLWHESSIYLASMFVIEVHSLLDSSVYVSLCTFISTVCRILRPSWKPHQSSNLVHVKPNQRLVFGHDLMNKIRHFWLHHDDILGFLEQSNERKLDWLVLNLFFLSSYIWYWWSSGTSHVHCMIEISVTRLSSNYPLSKFLNIHIE